MAQKINVLVEAGKASAGPPLGPALGPTGINVGQVIAAINEKTKDFAGMKVPVEVTIDIATKAFEIKTGSPPVSQLVKKEMGIDKLSGNPKVDKVGNLAIEQIIKVSTMKIDSLNCSDLKSAAKTIIGSCTSLGVLVEGMEPADAIKAVNAGKFDDAIYGGKTEVSAEKQKLMDSELEDAKLEHAGELADLEAAEAEKAEADAEKAEAGKVDAEGETPEAETAEDEKKEE